MSTHRYQRPTQSPPAATASRLDPPPYPPVPLPDKDARTHALEVLAKWMSSLVYRRTMAISAPSEAFQIPLDRIFIEQPDNVEGLVFPAIGIIPSRGQYLTRGLGGAEPDQSTITDEGIALVVPYDYQEIIVIEGIGSKISERRSIVSAIEVAASSYNGTTDLRLIMEDYFGLVATFTLMERENVDDVDIQRGRRRVHLMMQMTVPVVMEARYFGLQTSIDVGVDMIGNLNAQTSGLIKSSGLSGQTALNAYGLDLATARDIARATFGINQLQAEAMSVDMLLEMVRSLAAQNLRYKTATSPPIPDTVPTPEEIRSRLQRIATP